MITDVILILGANGSGKSAFAEKLAVWLYEKACSQAAEYSALFYLATMIPFGEEGAARVDKHRRQRAASGFITFEKPTEVSTLDLPSGAVVLLEDVSNLLSNAMFEGKTGGKLTKNAQDGTTGSFTADRPHNNIEDAVFEDIKTLCARCRASVLVSIDGLTPLPEYNDETRSYTDALNRLNRRLAEYAQNVVTLRDGVPVLTRGNMHRDFMATSING